MQINDVKEGGVRNWGGCCIARRICHWRPIILRAVRKTVSDRLAFNRVSIVGTRRSISRSGDRGFELSALVIVSFVYIVHVQGSQNGLTLFPGRDSRDSLSKLRNFPMCIWRIWGARVIERRSVVVSPRDLDKTMIFFFLFLLENEGDSHVDFLHYNSSNFKG